MSDLEKILSRFVRKFEKVGRKQEIGVFMMLLLIQQLDGRVQVSNDTMNLYYDALDGTVKKVEAFQKHVIERYFRE